MSVWQQLRGVLVAGALLWTAAGGCGRMPSFPVRLVEGDLRVLSFDVDGDGSDDYWQDIDPDGRKVALRFDEDRDGEPDHTVRLDRPATANDLHVVIVLDGVPFTVFDELYAGGRFRLFPPPSRLISVFPAMTDLALAKVFGAGPCLGYEARYYDVQKNRLSNGSGVYLAGANAPWTPAVDYRCSTSWDSLAYLNPAAVWRHELDGFIKTIAAADSGQVILYTVATAGLGTRGGREAIVEYLATIDALCEQVTYERRGQVRFTLLADHGHGLTACRRVSFSKALRAAGFRVGASIKDDRDVVMPTFGLVTCLAIHTRSPKQVAELVLGEEGTDLVMYPARDGSGIVVRSAAGEAHILRRGDRYTYDMVSGDPLKLQATLDELRAAGLVADDGSASDRDWFKATVTHVYPDPLHRIWCAFQPGEVVENPADVLVSLKEGYACGSKFFAALVKVKSTHGSLAAQGSTTFITSNAFELPVALRVAQVSNLCLHRLKTGATPGAGGW